LAPPPSAVKGRERKGNERDRGDVGIEAREDNTPFVSNVSHSKFFKINYGCLKKTLLSLIIKYCECAN